MRIQRANEPPGPVRSALLARGLYTARAGWGGICLFQKKPYVFRICWCLFCVCLLFLPTLLGFHRFSRRQTPSPKSLNPWTLTPKVGGCPAGNAGNRCSTRKKQNVKTQFVTTHTFSRAPCQSPTKPACEMLTWKVLFGLATPQGSNRHAHSGFLYRPSLV